MPSNRPNFLLVITDQQRADHLGCYGHPVLRTPHIDGIAARGTVFDRFYVTCPICMPNRAALMTGRMPSVNGVQTNGLPLPLEANTFVNLLRADGYRTALLGKSHLQNMVDHPIEDWNYPPGPDGRVPDPALTDAFLTRRSGPAYEAERGTLWRANPAREIALPYYGFDFVRFANAHGDAVHGHYTGWLDARHPDPASLIGPANALDSNGIGAPLAWRTRVPEALYSTTYVAETTIEYLQAHAAADGDAPFFVQCSFPDPHHPFTPPGKYWGMYDPADCPPPRSFGANRKDPPPMATRAHDALLTGQRGGFRVSPYAATEREIRESLSLTYGMITMIDDALGRILAELEALGLADDTVVIFTSDHGDLMGDHGLMLKHCFHYEGVLRVPFVWADPAHSRQAARTDLLSGTIDIGSSVLARAGIKAYHGMQGYDVVGAAREGRGLPRLGMVIEEDELPFNGGNEHYLRVRSFVTGRWRLTFWLEEGFGELYDRDADPHETENLWGDPGAAADKAMLLEMMMRERIALEEIAPRAELCA